LLHLLGSSHPGLTSIAEYYFKHPSKQLRPLLVLLFAQATNGIGRGWDEKWWAAGWEGMPREAREAPGTGTAGWGATTEELDRPLTRADVLNDWNPNMPSHTASFGSVFELRRPEPPASRPEYPHASSSSAHTAIPSLPTPPPILPTQRRLAQIVEMIHVASLLHDDVIDRSPLRRGVASAPAAFGNKFSVLAGDFLLGRASAALSRLGEMEAVELISSVVANLVEGEILQMGRVGEDTLGVDAGTSTGVNASAIGATPDGRVNGDVWNVYLKKTYLKTASLMAKGARAAVVLGGTKEGEVWKEVAYAYGRNLGIAFQVRPLFHFEYNCKRVHILTCNAPSSSARG
jgi:hexaprenyl-diphosphate synthase